VADTGLIVLGIVLILVGLLTGWFFCFGVFLAIAGFVILIYGAVKEERPAVVMYPPGYVPVYPVQPGYPAAPQAPSVAACPTCGTQLQWVAQYQRWFCTRCNQYR